MVAVVQVQEMTDSTELEETDALKNPGTYQENIPIGGIDLKWHSTAYDVRVYGKQVKLRKH